MARGDAVQAQALACRLVEEGVGGGCSPAEVATAFQVFQQAYRARLVESIPHGIARDRADRELLGVMLSCGNALAGALAAGMDRVQQYAAESRTLVRRLKEDRDQLTAIVEEDLRSAMAATTAALASIEPPTDPQSRARVLSACDALDRLRDRAERVIEVERLEKDGAVRPERARISDLLATVVRAWAEVARGRRITIEVEAEGLEVSADRGLVGRALDSFLENALRYTPSLGRIRVTARRDGDRAVITVWDSGPPLHPDVRDRAFDKYWTGGDATGGSRGLGLYLCRLVAERHGGEAWTDDHQGCCAFHLTLPLADAA